MYDLYLLKIYNPLSFSEIASAVWVGCLKVLSDTSYICTCLLLSMNAIFCLCTS